jgi:hypothetical protein
VPYSGDIDSALVAKLLNDATLAALMPDGVYWDIAASGKTRVVIVKLMSHAVEPMFGGRAYEAATYLVKAVELSTSGSNAKAAGRRIDALLDGGTLAINGYGLMTIALDEYVRFAEDDPDNADARWQHYGGIYAVTVSPA